jgi:tetratricopeptide (TPR) repeat protein
MAIRKLEKAQRECLNFKVYSSQVQLFFELSFGAIYDSLDYRLMAMKYFMKAKNTTEKFYQNDPDTALIYSYLGRLMISLREYDWAFRCFFNSKSVREGSIGGDAVDTATIYNNLGVCCYHMQCYYPAFGYFQLSYEIYKKNLGY